MAERDQRPTTEPLPSGMALRLLLAFRGVEPKALAEVCEVKVTQIRRYVTGEQQIPNKQRHNILTFFELTPVGWGIIEDAVVQLWRDAERFQRRQGRIAEDSGAVVPPSEIREPLGTGYPGLDPEAADSLVSGITRLVESTLHRILGPFVTRGYHT